MKYEGKNKLKIDLSQGGKIRPERGYRGIVIPGMHTLRVKVCERKREREKKK